MSDDTDAQAEAVYALVAVLRHSGPHAKLMADTPKAQLTAAGLLHRVERHSRPIDHDADLKLA